MNLHGIVSGAISAVNPPVPATLKRSNGYTQAADFSQVPAYLPDAAVQAQVQSLTYRDLMQLQGVNLNGERRAIYLYDIESGVDRQAVKGGDLIVFGSGVDAPLTNTTWLVVQQLEAWGGSAADQWCKLACTKQDD